MLWNQLQAIQSECDLFVIGGDVFDKYDGVRLDETGNLSDADFQATILKILSKNGLEVPKGTIEIKKNKALPDDSEVFLEMFVNRDTGEIKNRDVFQRRILGLTSYFRSAQEQLLPRIIKTEEGDVMHIIKCEMTPYQFGVYEKIRKIEADQDKKNRNRGKANDLFTISSTYRIFSRSACNFAFPPSIERPLPDKKGKTVITENDFNATPMAERQNTDVYLDEEDVEEEAEEGEEEENISYQKRIDNALAQLEYNPTSPRETEYVTKNSLEIYSPKFVKIIEQITKEENQGLHLLYSQFRTIEGIGILKIILQANGFAEFKIQKREDVWEMVEKANDVGKPRFVLYTGTETTEEKDIVRNIYNSSWDLVPSNITMKLREQIQKLPVGKVISVEPSAMTLVRYHARGCRSIVSAVNLKTGKRDVLLGDFFNKGTK
jgi:hypothetical protein